MYRIVLIAGLLCLLTGVDGSQSNSRKSFTDLLQELKRTLIQLDHKNNAGYVPQQRGGADTRGSGGGEHQKASDSTDQSRALDGEGQYTQSRVAEELLRELGWRDEEENQLPHQRGKQDPEPQKKANPQQQGENGGKEEKKTYDEYKLNEELGRVVAEKRKSYSRYSGGARYSARYYRAPRYSARYRATRVRVRQRVRHGIPSSRVRVRHGIPSSRVRVRVGGGHVVHHYYGVHHGYYHNDVHHGYHGHHYNRASAALVSVLCGALALLGYFLARCYVRD